MKCTPTYIVIPLKLKLSNTQAVINHLISFKKARTAYYFNYTTKLLVNIYI